jgi:hypothetical protein
VHPDLLLAQKLAYDPLKLQIENFRSEPESKDYGAADFKIHHSLIKFRVGKITPTKIGQFVTFWKRVGQGPILPYDVEDPFDYLMISARLGHHFGQFIFPKATLDEQAVLSKNNQGGKRAFRIYPPWDQTNNSQARKTQSWQLCYFFELSRATDFTPLLSLFQPAQK